MKTNHMTSEYDLHCHSSASDGTLTPSELVRQAHAAGVKTLALTDHDTVAGIPEAVREAATTDMTLLAAIELSVTWRGKCLHLVGLNIDSAFEPLLRGIDKIQATRIDRAEQIARRLAKKGIEGASDAVNALADKGMITRTHFARFIVSQDKADSLQHAFDRYLSRGKPAYVPTIWATLEEAVGWIRGAGGIAVLAHPLRYKLSSNAMRKLLSAFKESGGQGIEVVCGRNNSGDIQTSAGHARRFNLAGSVGSDFHSPENPWIALGRLAPLPADITPVWSLW
ncbi:MAG: PHP domain-containing protein [Pseudomonadota bacterium]